MARRWEKEVPIDDIKDDGDYFIAKFNDFSGHRNYMYLARGLNKKLCWSVKPGIAIRYVGGDGLKEHLAKNNGAHVALEVPKDADKRWKARKRR